MIKMSMNKTFKKLSVLILFLVWVNHSFAQTNPNSQTTTYTNATLASQDAFRKTIYLERRLELALECDRWFDIIRTGQLATAMPLIPSFRSIYPVPQLEIDNVNDKTDWQNDGC